MIKRWKGFYLTISTFGGIINIISNRMPGMPERSGSSGTTRIFIHGEMPNRSDVYLSSITKTIIRKKTPIN